MWRHVKFSNLELFSLIFLVPYSAKLAISAKPANSRAGTTCCTSLSLLCLRVKCLLLLTRGEGGYRVMLTSCHFVKKGFLGKKMFYKTNLDKKNSALYAFLPSEFWLYCICTGKLLGVWTWNQLHTTFTKEFYKFEISNRKGCLEKSRYEREKNSKYICQKNSLVYIP